jgi:hypothetical protein
MSYLFDGGMGRQTVPWSSTWGITAGQTSGASGEIMETESGSGTLYSIPEKWVNSVKSLSSCTDRGAG